MCLSLSHELEFITQTQNSPNLSKLGLNFECVTHFESVLDLSTEFKIMIQI
jgi:hypothetical protein